MKFTEIVQVEKEKDQVKKHRRNVRSKSHQREYYIQRWHESNLTRKAFCKEHAIHLKTFSNWLGQAKLLKKHTDCAEINKVQSPDVISSTNNNYNVKFQWPNGVQLNIDGQCGVALIVSIIKGTL